MTDAPPSPVPAAPALAPLADFEAWLDRWLRNRAAHPRLLDAMHHGVLGGGKRFRANLVFAAARLAGTPIGAAYPVAGAIELVHAYSLVHDDLPAMDDAALRRGQPTLHRRFDEATAVLAGDALLTDAFALLCETAAPPRPIVATVQLLADAAGMQGMVSGQMGDIRDLPGTTDVADVRHIHAQKTGALIRFSLLAPLILWGAPATVRADVERYADHLGVLYQVRDDLLDLDPAAAQDKDRQADALKSTYARLLGVAAAQQAAQEELDACLREAAALPAPHDATFAALARWTVGRTQ